MSLQLPIYRSLNQKVRIFGFSVIELTVLAVTFVIFNQALDFMRYHSLLALLIVIFTAAFFRMLHLRFEAHFLVRLMRFVRLPHRLERKYEQLNAG